MPDQLRGLLDRNVLTALAVGLIVAVVLISFAAAVTGHYDSASVRAWIDDLKWIAGLLGLGVAGGRGLIAAGQRIADAHTEAAIAQHADVGDLEPRGATVKHEGFQPPAES